jgi:glycerol-3-phosphate cytidylyltransferase-like family protein
LAAAAEIGNVFVLLNSDAWLKRKKGYVFMTFDQRRKILLAIKHVMGVYEVDDLDSTVCEGLRQSGGILQRAGFKVVFAKGGDRTIDNTPEQDVCREMGIDVIFDVGGEKVASSSELVRALVQA